MSDEAEELVPPVEWAAAILRGGGLVAVPTDTQYGIAALADQDVAIRRLFALKGRPPGEALPIFLPDRNWLEVVCQEVPEWVRGLTEAAWPGPLTLVLKRRPSWRSAAVPGETVAVRVPSHPVALALLATLGAPITGTSANRHGQPAATRTADVRQAFGDALPVLPEMGRAPQGQASTVLDCREDAPRVLRHGALSESRVSALLGRWAPVGSGG